MQKISIASTIYDFVCGANIPSRSIDNSTLIIIRIRPRNAIIIARSELVNGTVMIYRGEMMKRISRIIIFLRLARA